VSFESILITDIEYTDKNQLAVFFFLTIAEGISSSDFGRIFPLFAINFVLAARQAAG
jgi:hypothetical protein